MSALSSAHDDLVAFLVERGIDPPTRAIRLVEITPDSVVGTTGRIRVPRDTLRAPSEVEQRFDTLVTSGLSRVNVSCYGVKDTFLLVGIEASRTTLSSNRPTSINFAGPPLSVIENGWNSDASIGVD